MNDARSTRLGERTVGGGAPCYLLAEVGTTALGELDRALALVEAAAASGVDAVKFQLIDPFQDVDGEATYKVVWDGVESEANMRDMFAALTFEPHEWATIAQAAREAGVEFLATCDYLDGIDLLETLGVVAHKIGAWDTTYRPLIERIARTGKPMIADLGPTTEAELEDLERWYADAGGPLVIPLHDYHTDVADQMNLRAIPYLAGRATGPVGFSSPNRDSDVDLLALALGADLLEKRLILSRSDRAFHAHESLEPDELRAWVRRIRHAEAALGEPAIRPSQNDLAGAQKYYRSIATLVDVAKGTELTEAMIDGKRPGTGVATARIGEFVGRRAARDLPADTLIGDGDVL